MEEVKVICLSWLQPRLLKYETIKSSGTEVMYNNISKYAPISVSSGLCL